ncbi:MAG: DUF5700 domain-containing putative Zn-dependent protease [Candidatus Heimdallarchaeaceae archaeon]
MTIKFDFSAYYGFKELIKKKVKKEKINEELEELFSTKGYEILFEQEYNKDFFSNVFKFVLYPELVEATESEKLKRYERYINHFKNIISLQDQIEEGIETIKKQTSKFQSNITNRAFSLLPFVEEQDVSVFITVFDIDARGRKDNCIIVDPIFCSHTESFAAILAHELHHIYRNKLLCFDLTEVKEEDKELIWLLNQLQGEGIADQIDKEYFIFSKEKTIFPAEYIIRFIQDFNTAREKISIINNYIEKVAQTVEHNKKKELLKELREKITLGGHPIGFYMTMIIIKEMLYDELIKDVGNPFRFIKLYNQAALGDREPLPLFSKMSLEYINKLEKAYCK